MRRQKINTNSLLGETKRILRHFNLKTKKGLGQHFLIDRKILKTVIIASELNPKDNVIEIGPGLGIVTRELMRMVRYLIAVELDHQLVDVLKRDLSSYNNVSIIEDDFLKISINTLLESFQAPVNYKVVANLPYYIATPAIRHFLEATFKPQLMVVMVQKEVAEAIIAKHGRTSILSMGVHFYGEPKIIAYVPARSFYPVPKVDSAILQIRLYAQPLFLVDEYSFFQLVRAAFSSPRKQVINSLAQGLKISRLETLTLLNRANIDYHRRPGTLKLDELVKLWELFHHGG